MSRKHDRASELRAIAEGRLLLNVRNGVTIPRSMLAKIADEMDAERAAHAETKRERDDLKDEWQAEFESRVEANTALRMTKARLAEAMKAINALVDLNDNHSPFGGELYQDRIGRAWDAARRVREGGKVE